MRGIYHLSPIAGLTRLRPSTPAEDIISGGLQWAMDDPLPGASDCVCCGTDIAAILAHNPMLSGYIYEPLTTETPRQFFREAIALAESGGEWLDSGKTGEVRYYRTIRVRCVGTFLMDPAHGMKQIIYLY